MNVKKTSVLSEEVLKSRAEHYARTEDVVSVKGRLVPFLHLRLGREQYLVEARWVDEVVRMGHVSRFPRQKDCLLGVTNVRGSLVPVMDVAGMLGIPVSRAVKTSRVVLLKNGAHVTGFLADEVFGHVKFDSALAQAPGASLARSGADCVTGLFERDGVPLAWLYIERILEIINQQLAA